MTVINLREAFKGRTVASDIKAVAETIREDIRDGKLSLTESADGKAKQVSLRNLAEATLGADVVATIMNPSYGNGGLVESLREAVDPVRLSAFSNITGELILRVGTESFKSPELIGDKLVTAETDNQDNVREVGLDPIDDDAMEVAEGEEYKSVKFGENYLDRPSSKKRGLRIALTKEMVFFDKTGQLAKMAAGVGERLGINKEKRILRVVLGIDNPFSRNGVARNTYVASADPRINKLASNELVDWTDVENIEQLFAAYEDDRENGDGGEPISVIPDTMIVMPAKLHTARRILNATEVEHSANSIVTRSANPVKGMTLLSNQWVYWMLTNARHGNIAAAQAKKYTFVGQPKKAFVYTTLFPFSMVQSSGGAEEFDRDVVAQWKASERGVAWVRSPWHMALSYDD
jgi:hypothetical protein